MEIRVVWFLGERSSVVEIETIDVHECSICHLAQPHKTYNSQKNKDRRKACANTAVFGPAAKLLTGVI
jgi:hypothetical protein